MNLMGNVRRVPVRDGAAIGMLTDAPIFLRNVPASLDAFVPAESEPRTVKLLPGESGQFDVRLRNPFDRPLELSASGQTVALPARGEKTVTISVSADQGCCVETVGLEESGQRGRDSDINAVGSSDRPARADSATHGGDPPAGRGAQFFIAQCDGRGYRCIYVPSRPADRRLADARGKVARNQPKLRRLAASAKRRNVFLRQLRAIYGILRYGQQHAALRRPMASGRNYVFEV